MIPRLAITPGEPAGIGPELCLQLAQERAFEAELVVIADRALLAQRARQLGLNLRLQAWHEGPPRPHRPGRLTVLQQPCASAVTPGRLDPANAGYVLDCLRQAVRGCQNGLFQAMVTGPVQKSVINQAGIPFSGHTEFLAELTQSELPVMMLATEGLRVALVTTHLPLREVSDHITHQRVGAVLRILHRDLQQRFGLARPRILVCGLNPHAGEDGHLGHEDQQAITPAIAELRAQGLDIHGPLPADTLFTPNRLRHADAVLAMYHDQGLPVLKHLGFGRAINITLGLPIIRTSVDHGTALDLAGSGRADNASLALAIETAIHMARAQMATDPSRRQA